MQKKKSRVCAPFHAIHTHAFARVDVAIFRPASCVAPAVLQQQNVVLPVFIGRERSAMACPVLGLLGYGALSIWAELRLQKRMQTFGMTPSSRLLLKPDMGSSALHQTRYAVLTKDSNGQSTISSFVG